MFPGIFTESISLAFSVNSINLLYDGHRVLCEVGIKVLYRPLFQIKRLTCFSRRFESGQIYERFGGKNGHGASSSISILGFAVSVPPP